MLRQPTSRRGFLKGSGALVVTISLAGALPPLAQARRSARRSRRPRLRTADPTNWTRTSRSAVTEPLPPTPSKVELGQGNQTALTQIMAEELDVPLGRVNLVMGDTANSIQEFGTDGSVTIADAGGNLRVAAAEARQALVDMAANQLNVAADSLVVQRRRRQQSQTGRRASRYAQLIGDKQFNVTLKALTAPDGSLVPFTTALSGTATPKDPSQVHASSARPCRASIFRQSHRPVHVHAGRERAGHAARARGAPDRRCTPSSSASAASPAGAGRAGA